MYQQYAIQKTGDGISMQTRGNSRFITIYWGLRKAQNYAGRMVFFSYDYSGNNLLIVSRLGAYPSTIH